MESKEKTDPTPNPLAAFETDDATMANALIVGVGNDLMTSSASPSSLSHVHNPILTYAKEDLSAWTRGGGPGSIRPNTNGAMSPLASPLLSPALISTENPMMMQINDEIIDINNDCVDCVGTSELVMEKIAVAFGSSNNLQQMIDQPVLGLREESFGNEYEPPTNRQCIRSYPIPIKSERRLSQSLGSQGMASAAAAVANSSRLSPSDDRLSPGLFSIGSSKPKLKPNSSAPALCGFRRTHPSHAGGITYSDSAGSLQSEDTAGTISPPMFVDGVIPIGIEGGRGVTGNKMGGNSMRIKGSTNATGGEVTSFDTTTTSTAKKITSAKPKPADKRQRQLERNRKSARESRRRRKHYLEELEGRVSGLSEEMDQERMAHASAAVRTLREMRTVALGNAVEQLLLNGNHLPVGSTGMATSSLDKAANALVTHLSRTSTELQVVQTFMRQHLLSLVQPPSTRFVLWLSLQDDGFYRSGRSASERLSAARIGERLLQAGTDRVSPNTTMMWPLVCHEISISYEQEEKVRGMQRTILTNADGWIHRHTALATRKVIEGVHDVVCGSQAAAGERERILMRIMTPEQSLKYMAWTKRKADLIKRLAERNARVGGGAVAPFARSCNAVTRDFGDGEYKTSSDSHLSANLYIINHILSKVLQRQQQDQQRCGTNASTTTVSIPPTKLRKLGRRPSYESLAGLQAAEDAAKSKKSSPEESHLSTGSLKRSLTSMASLGGDSYNDSNNDLNAMSSNAITLETSQIAGQAAVISVLRDVLPIVPKEAWYHPPMGATVQPHTMTAVPSSSVPQAARKPKSNQQVQQLKNLKPRPAHSQQSQPSQFDMPDVDNIPMPTPVSELLRTFDDLVSPQAYKRQEPLVAHTSSGFNSLPIGYASRHKSAPQLEAFSHSSNDTGYSSFMPSQKMASIPEMDVLISHNTVVAQVNHANEFATPEQINSHSSYTSQQLGHRHQSAPQFDTVSILTMMPEIDDPIGDFAMLEEFDFSSQLPSMDADDWAIGEGFEMDVEGSPRTNNFVR